MYTEDNLLPVSAVQHMVFCTRRAALALIEGLWVENIFTIEGRHLHERAHEPETEVRGDIRIVRGLRLRSMTLGLVGVADIVEFHRQKEDNPATDAPIPEAVPLPALSGRWRPFPVEYKRGVLKHDRSFEAQLCAQALCIEEMLQVHIPMGALFYGKSARRREVIFDTELRKHTCSVAHDMHVLFDRAETPTHRYQSKCDACSFLFRCMPKAAGKSADRYLHTMLRTQKKEDDGKTEI